jgi:glycosyltransferase involved in cell wall biosynthesis
MLTKTLNALNKKGDVVLVSKISKSARISNAVKTANRWRNCVVKPWISIIVPTLNEEKRIAFTLNELRKLAPDAEIVVADGGSNDHTREVAARIADKVIRSTHEGEHKSIGAGRNAGARAARAPLMLFNDADTLPQKAFVDALRSAFDDERVLGAGCRVMPDQENYVVRLVFRFFNFIIRVSAWTGHPAISGNCVAYRTSAFWKVKGFDEEMEASEDQDLSVRMSRIGRVLFFNDFTAFTSSRRLKKFGWLGLFFDWGKTTLNFVLGRKNRRYAIVREL